MNIIILNEEEAIKIYPLAKMLSDTGKPIGDFCGIDVYSTKNKMGKKAIVIDKEELQSWN